MVFRDSPFSVFRWIKCLSSAKEIIAEKSKTMINVDLWMHDAIAVGQNVLLIELMLFTQFFSKGCDIFRVCISSIYSLINNLVSILLN